MVFGYCLVIVSWCLVFTSMSNKISKSKLGVRFLWRKFIFFGVLAVASIAAINYTDIHPGQTMASLFNRMQVAADEVTGNAGSGGSNYNIDIELLENGKAKVNGKNVREKVSTYGDYDGFLYVVFDGDKKAVPNYYNQVVANIHLPKAVTDATLPTSSRRLIIAHGVGSSDSKIIDSRTIRLTAYDVPNSGVVTVSINFPKNYFNLGAVGAVETAASKLPGTVWLMVSIIFPIISLIALISVYNRTTGMGLNNPPTFVADAPPDNLSPAEVGILTHGRIRPKELLSSVVDLANRGILGIDDKDGELIIYKKQIKDQNLWQNLRPFEAAIINELFGNKKILNTASEISTRDGKELFNKKVTKIYEDLYGSVAAMGLFEKNPAATHWRYRITGIAMFFLGTLGFFYGTIKFADPKFTLFFWAAMIGISLITIFMAGKISTRAASGRTELAKWLGFRNFLGLPRPLSLMDARELEFQKYLPYAIALDVEYEWAARFSKTDFELPEWYGSSRKPLDVREFAQNFFPLLGGFLSHVAYIKEPTIE